MIEPLLIVWVISVLVGFIFGYRAYQKESEVKQLWGMLMIASSTILSFLGVAISIIMFFLFVTDSTNTGRTEVEY